VNYLYICICIYFDFLLFLRKKRTLKFLMHYLYMQGPEVRSGDVPQPILLKEGQEFSFTIKRGVSTDDTVSVNYDDFVNDVEAGDILLVDGKYRCPSWELNW
jgi:pyruvate kinase